MIATRLAGLVVLAVSAQGALADCREDRVEIRGDTGVQRFRVELAQTAAERARGLMFREQMPAGAGMLFVYPEPQLSTSFWMQNTLIPLDIIYMDATGTVKTIQPMAKPLDTTPLPGGPGIQYVLEINGGLAERMGIEPGSELRHPAILPALAAWPCGDDAVTREEAPGETYEEGAGTAQDPTAIAPEAGTGPETETDPAEGTAPGPEADPAPSQGPGPSYSQDVEREEEPAAPPPPTPEVHGEELPPAENDEEN